MIFYLFLQQWWIQKKYPHWAEGKRWILYHNWFRVISFLLGDTPLQSNSKCRWTYSYFFRQGKNVEWVEGVRHISESDDQIVRLSHCKVSKSYLRRFGYEGFLTFETLLLFDHVVAVELPSLSCFLLFEKGHLSNVKLSVFVLGSLHLKL